MAEEKKLKSLWQIFMEGVKIYCFNFPQFFLYMAFPVLGQILSVVLMFTITYIYSTKMIDLAYQSPMYYLLLVLVSILPVMAILIKAFWDYLVAYGALNSMTEGYLSTGKVYDFRAHKSTVTQKTGHFIALWFLFSMFTLFAVFPLFWVIGFIFFVYFVLIFQVFTFENVSPIGYFKRSFQIIKGHFAKTFCLMALLFVVYAYIITPAVTVIFDCIKLSNGLTGIFEVWLKTLPLEPLYALFQNIKQPITSLDLAKTLTSQVIFFIVFGFTLPLRSICWTLWYKNLNVPIVKPKRVRQPKEE